MMKEDFIVTTDRTPLDPQDLYAIDQLAQGPDILRPLREVSILQGKDSATACCRFLATTNYIQ